MKINPEHFNILNWEIRPNIFTEVGDKILFHKHDFDHLALIWRGKFKLKFRNKEIIVSSGSLSLDVLETAIEIERETEHEFEVLELENNVAVIWCMWPEGVK